MSEIADTPNLARSWCPGCYPDADPTREILETRYCGEHEIRTTGSDDAAVAGPSFLSGSGEAEALACRAVQAIIR